MIIFKLLIWNKLRLWLGLDPFQIIKRKLKTY